MEKIFVFYTKTKWYRLINDRLEKRLIVRQNKLDLLIDRTLKETSVNLSSGQDALSEPSGNSFELDKEIKLGCCCLEV